jgi:hypothetical protein
MVVAPGWLIGFAGSRDAQRGVIFEGGAAAEDDLGSFRDGLCVAAAAVGAADGDSVEEAVHEAPLFLGGEGGPSVEEISVGEFVREGALGAEFCQRLTCFVEGVLSRFGSVKEFGFAEDGEESWVGEVEVELVFGFVDSSDRFVDLL